MCFFHNWTKWETIVNEDKGKYGFIKVKVRQCLKCHKKQTKRTVL